MILTKKKILKIFSQIFGNFFGRPAARAGRWPPPGRPAGPKWPKTVDLGLVTPPKRSGDPKNLHKVYNNCIITPHVAKIMPKTRFLGPKWDKWRFFGRDGKNFGGKFWGRKKNFFSEKNFFFRKNFFLSRLILKSNLEYFKPQHDPRRTRVAQVSGGRAPGPPQKWPVQQNGWNFQLDPGRA